jgi:glycosyltransferase involved in cell wall biosynthesis
MIRLKILHISTFSINSGAGIATSRLNEAFNRHGWNSNIITLYNSNSKLTPTFKKTFLKKKIQIIKEKRLIQKKDDYIHFSSGEFGTDLSKLKAELVSADVIHVHWVQNNFLSYDNLAELLKEYGHKLIFNLHDTWFFTGGCHITLDCKKFETDCYRCPRLLENNNHLPKLWVFKKSQLFKNTVVCCPSSYLKNKVLRSSISPKIVEVIPNTIDTDFYKTKPKVRNSITKKVLFMALNTEDPYKGVSEFLEALKKIKSKGVNNIEILFLGANSVKFDSPYKTTYFDRTSDILKIADLFYHADVYVNSSHEESFGQTVLEAIASGTPVVAFNNSGCKEILLHKKNGYLAEFKDESDLANGILFSLNNLEFSESSFSQHVKEKFDFEIIQTLYEKLYEKLSINNLN